MSIVCIRSVITTLFLLSFPNFLESARFDPNDYKILLIENIRALLEPIILPLDGRTVVKKRNELPSVDSSADAAQQIGPIIKDADAAKVEKHGTISNDISPDGRTIIKEWDNTELVVDYSDIKNMLEILFTLENGEYDLDTFFEQLTERFWEEHQKLYIYSENLINASSFIDLVDKRLDKHFYIRADDLRMIIRYEPIMEKVNNLVKVAAERLFNRERMVYLFCEHFLWEIASNIQIYSQLLDENQSFVFHQILHWLVHHLIGKFEAKILDEAIKIEKITIDGALESVELEQEELEQAKENCKKAKEAYESAYREMASYWRRRWMINAQERVDQKELDLAIKGQEEYENLSYKLMEDYQRVYDEFLLFNRRKIGRHEFVRAAVKTIIMSAVDERDTEKMFIVGYYFRAMAFEEDYANIELIADQLIDIICEKIEENSQEKGIEWFYEGISNANHEYLKNNEVNFAILLDKAVQMATKSEESDSGTEHSIQTITAYRLYINLFELLMQQSHENDKKWLSILVQQLKEFAYKKRFSVQSNVGNYIQLHVLATVPTHFLVSTCTFVNQWDILEYDRVRADLAHDFQKIDPVQVMKLIWVNRSTKLTAKQLATLVEQKLNKNSQLFKYKGLPVINVGNIMIEWADLFEALDKVMKKYIIKGRNNNIDKKENVEYKMLEDRIEWMKIMLFYYIVYSKLKMNIDFLSNYLFFEPLRDWLKEFLEIFKNDLIDESNRISEYEYLIKQITKVENEQVERFRKGNNSEQEMQQLKTMLSEDQIVEEKNYRDAMEIEIVLQWRQYEELKNAKVRLLDQIDASIGFLNYYRYAGMGEQWNQQKRQLFNETNQEELLKYLVELSENANGKFKEMKICLQEFMSYKKMVKDLIEILNSSAENKEHENYWVVKIRAKFNVIKQKCFDMNIEKYELDEIERSFEESQKYVMAKQLVVRNIQKTFKFVEKRIGKFKVKHFVESLDKDFILKEIKFPNFMGRAKANFKTLLTANWGRDSNMKCGDPGLFPLYSDEFYYKIGLFYILFFNELRHHVNLQIVDLLKLLKNMPFFDQPRLAQEVKENSLKGLEAIGNFAAFIINSLFHEFEEYMITRKQQNPNISRQIDICLDGVKKVIARKNSEEIAMQIEKIKADMNIA